MLKSDWTKLKQVVYYYNWLFISESGECGTIIDDGYLQGNFDNVTDCPPITSQASTGTGIHHHIYRLA
jgi:hypothetical protein